MTTTRTSTKKSQAALVLLAAGSSQRMEGLGKKEFLPLEGGTVLSKAAGVFLKTGLFSTVIVTVPKGLLQQAKNAFFAEPQIKSLSEGVLVKFIFGGPSREESVLLALRQIARIKKTEGQFPVLIHDAARPFLKEALVKRIFNGTVKYGAAVPALTPVDTQKEIRANKTISRHLLRKDLAAVQTPQGFLFPDILTFHLKAKKEGGLDSFTDDTEIWDKYSQKKVRVLLGESQNTKITYPKDAPQTNAKTEAAFRVGLGTDLHRLVPGRKLLLGGVHIPFKMGEDGHSDGDALLHAITDSLLGAAGLGDIGSYFPSEDKKWKDADSKKLLAAAWNDVQKSGWALGNLDCVVKLQSPKFLPYRQRVCQCIAKILGVSKERVFVKAKTGEHIGPVGLGQAVETEAVCLLVR